jgi:hypothetical protein
MSMVPFMFCRIRTNFLVQIIEEGGAVIKSPHKNFGFFLSISQQVVSANITKNSAVAVFEL